MAGYRSLQHVAYADPELLVKTIEHLPRRFARQLVSSALVSRFTFNQINLNTTINITYMKAKSASVNFLGYVTKHAPVICVL